MIAAAALIDELSRAGVRIERRGDRLHVEAPKGAVTPELRLVLTERKADLLTLLSADAHEVLRDIAAAEGMDRALVNRLTPADVAACHGLPHDTLCAYVAALRDAALREQGKAPADETAAALCRHCGPVFVHPSVARVAPFVAGWSRLLGCAWCHVRNRTTLPRPPVKCGECSWLLSNPRNPDAGMGQCSLAPPAPVFLPFPNVVHRCGNFQPKEN